MSNCHRFHKVAANRTIQTGASAQAAALAMVAAVGADLVSDAESIRKTKPKASAMPRASRSTSPWVSVKGRVRVMGSWDILREV